MRLPQYDYSGNGAYFITVCTKDRRSILCDIVGDEVGFRHNTVFETLGEQRNWGIYLPTLFLRPRYPQRTRLPRYMRIYRKQPAKMAGGYILYGIKNTVQSTVFFML